MSYLILWTPQHSLYGKFYKLCLPNQAFSHARRICIQLFFGNATLPL